jgi:hypothetical protein
MAERRAGRRADSGGGSRDELVPELEPRQLEQLTELVYRLIREEWLRARERRGESAGKDWR